MSNYLIEINDKSETSLKIKVELPIVGQDKWTVLDKAGWVYNAGVAKIIDKTNYKTLKGEKPIVHKHLNLSNTEKVFWAGVILWDFQGSAKINQSGSGVIEQGWSLKIDYCQPRSSKIIRWRIIS